MALLVHSGTGALDLNAADTKRDDISDVLLASLSNENNTLGITPVGEEFADLQLYWVEDALNQYKVTTTSSAASNGTTFSVSQSDASVLDIGYILQPDSQVGFGEQMQVTAIAGTTVTVSRAYAYSAQQASVANGAVLRIVNAPTYTNSDLGKDMSRARISKTNYINRFEINVNLDSEQILRSLQGYVPGVRNELGYQFQQRVIELKRKMQQAYLFSVGNAAGNPTNEYQTMHGLLAWLDTTANANASPVNTAESLTDSVINTMAKNIFRQGAASNVVIGGPNVVEKVGQLYTDRIRFDQSERGRGFFAQYFTPSMANEHRLINEAYLNDTTGNAMLILADLSRIRIRPYVGSFFYTIQAPTFRDGDAVRCLSKWSMEVRNSGTDAGYAHQLHKNLSL